MGRDFVAHAGLWQRFAPPTVQAALSMPTPIAKPTVNEDGTVEPFVGRVELVIGKLGAGKTTWAALRCTRLARATDRELVTNGVGWPAPWRCISSFDEMEALRNCVFAWDELHLMMPSSKGLLSGEVERFLIRWLSLCRKRGICVVGTTQAWTRCATHYRQLITTVWVADFIRRGALHMATPFEHPDDGGTQAFARQWFGPAAANIPTRAIVWRGFDVDEDSDGYAVPSTARAGGTKARHEPVPTPAFELRRPPASLPAPNRAHNVRAPGDSAPGAHVAEGVSFLEHHRTE